MPLTLFQEAAQINWNLTGSNAAPFPQPTQSGSLGFTLGSLNLATWNQVYATQLTITASSTTAVVLTSLTNLVNESFSFAHVLAIGVYVTTATAANIKFGPGALNPLQWFFDDLTATVQVDNGGFFLWSDPSTSSGTAVSGTHKQLDFTNLSGAVSANVQIVILGSTT